MPAERVGVRGERTGVDARLGVLGLVALGALAILAVAGASGCSRGPGAPRVQVGTPCAACGMTVRDVRFACVRRNRDGDQQYDSIECLMKDVTGNESPSTRVYLADYDESSLHAADSLWVVKGDFSSPMGGGLAAFGSLESAREVANRTNGRVSRFVDLGHEAPR